jgi:predicted dehydrogenase
MSATPPLSVGLVGFGDAGRGIHAPLLLRAGLQVTVVATSDAGRAAAVAQDLPGARVVPGLEAVLGAGCDLVVLTSPSGVHAEQALACLTAGVPVVVEKPLATDATEAARVAAVAASAGVPLTVFHNRRWDDEQRTLRALLADGALGEVYRFERRWERWRPEPKDRWRENASAAEGGGLLLDLHTHLVDSAVQLFGPVTSVYAEVASHTTAAEDDAFLACTHVGGVRSHLGAMSVAAAPGPRTRVLGTKAAYVATAFEGEVSAFGPADADVDHCGWLVAGEARIPVPVASGEHADFYRLVARALRAGTPMPVDPADAVHTLAVVDAARVSAATRTVAVISTPSFP